MKDYTYRHAFLGVCTWIACTVIAGAMTWSAIWASSVNDPLGFYLWVVAWFLFFQFLTWLSLD